MTAALMAHSLDRIDSLSGVESNANRETCYLTTCYLPTQHAGRFSKKAEMPSCASAAMEFMVIISFA